MDKRTALTLALCMLIMIVYMYVHSLIYPPQEVEESQDPKSTGTESVEPGQDGVEEAARPRLETPDQSADDSPDSESDEEPGLETDYPPILAEDVDVHTVESGDFRLELTNRGASIQKMLLKNYTQDAGGNLNEDEDWLVLLSEFDWGHRALMLEDPTQKNERQAARLDQALWQKVSSEKRQDGSEVVHYRYASGDGLVFEKLFIVPARGYLIDVELRIWNENPDLTGREKELNLVGAAGLHREGVPWDPHVPLMDGSSVIMMGRSGGQSGIYAVGVEDLSLKLEDVASKQLEEGQGFLPVRPDRTMQWVGIHDFYFGSALDGGAADGIEGGEFVSIQDRDKTGKVAVLATGPGNGPEEAPRLRMQCQLNLKPRIPPVGENQAVSMGFRFYAGPKSRKVLNVDGYERYRTLLSAGRTYCIFPSYIVDPIVGLFTKSLMLFQGWFGSYGVAIIVLTLIVRTVMFPVTLKQQASMAKYQKSMSKVKPEMDRLKEKYKKNSKKMQQEQMALFKKHGINPLPPLGGCLPMLLTMPVFIGMFYTFGMSIELRHTTFLWIGDLAQPDRFVKNPFPIPCPLGCMDLTWINILPIVMSATWVLQGKMQQKNMPKSLDPQMAQQQQMMAYMPAMIGLVLYNYAAGVHLYQFTSSLLGIIEQKYVRKHFLPQDPPPGADKKPAKGSFDVAKKGGGKGKRS